MAHSSKNNVQRARPTGGAQGATRRGGAPNTRAQTPAPIRAQTPTASASPARAAATDAQRATLVTSTSAVMPANEAPPTPESPASALPVGATSAAATTPATPTAGGGSGAFWREWSNWSNRRLVSVGAVAIGVVIVLSLLLHGLLTPAVAATPSLHATPQPPDPLIGHYAPTTDMVDLSNNPVTLSSLKGKIVVLNFWYAACEPCRYEMPALEKAYQTYRSQGVVVLGIDMVDSAQTASGYVHSLGVTYPIALDVHLHTVQTYKVFATPTTFFIDRQGVIRYKSLGALNTTTLNTDLTALLKA